MKAQSLALSFQGDAFDCGKDNGPKAKPTMTGMAETGMADAYDKLAKETESRTAAENRN